MPEDIRDEVSVKELILGVKKYFLYFRSKWKIIFLAGIIGGTIGFSMGYVQKPFYTAALSFALEDEKSGGGGGGLSVLASQFGFDVGGSAGGAFASQNLIELMKSRTVVEKTFLQGVMIENHQISLIEFYLKFNKIRDGWINDPLLKDIRFLPNSDRSKFTRQQDSILGVIYEGFISNSLNIFVRDKKVSIISIEVKSENELFAKLFTEQLAQEISEFYIETKSQKAKLNLSILQKQTDSIRAELYAGLTGVASLNDNTFNLNPALNVMRVPSAKRQINVQANSAMLSQLVQNLEMAKVTLRKETPLIQIIDGPILPLKKNKISIVRYVLAGGILAGFIMLFFIWMYKLSSQYILG